MAFSEGRALVIGVGSYPDIIGADIPTSFNDASEMQAVLQDNHLCGYLPERVAFLHHRTARRDDILDGLKTLSQASETDTVLIYYSGHGSRGPDGTFYLTGHDTRAYGGVVVPLSAISEGELLTSLRAIPARRLIFFFNACFSGSISPDLGLEGEEPGLAFANLPDRTSDAILSSGEGRIIITACREEQRSWVGPGKCSLFAQALVDGLRGKGWAPNRQGYIGAFGLYTYLYEAVQEAASNLGHTQEPTITVLKGIGAFPVSLYSGAREHAQPFEETLDQAAGMAVRQTSRNISQRIFNQVIQTNIQGSVYTQNGDVIINPTIIYPPIPDEAEAAEKKRKNSRKNYLEALRDDCLKLPLAPLGEEDGADITLKKVYIALNVAGEPQGEREENVPALVASAAIPRLVLLGDPGSGKSTFVHYLLAEIISSELEGKAPPAGFEPGLTPILVSLRRLAEHLNLPGLDKLAGDEQERRLLDGLRAYLDDALPRLGKKAGAYAEELAACLEEGSYLLALDGLDEMPGELRGRVGQLVAALKASPAGNVRRIIITCRVRSYSEPAALKGFEARTLAPFNEGQIEAFASAWYRAKNKDKTAAEERAGDLAKAALDLLDMAQNPMLLTSMACLHQRGTGLPKQRVLLYAEVIDILVRRWQKYNAGEESLPADLADFINSPERLQPALAELAYEAHRASADPQKPGDLPRGKALIILDQPGYLNDIGLADKFLTYVNLRAGILVGYGGEPGKPDSFGFPHRSIQEYLAGRHLFGQRRPINILFQHAGDNEGWNLAVQLGSEELFYRTLGGQGILLDLLYQVSGACEPVDAARQRMLYWAARITRQFGADAVIADTATPGGGEQYLKRISRQLCEVLGGQLTLPERLETSQILTCLGDSRAEVMMIEDMPFCYIQAGSFLMGERNDILAGGVLLAKGKNIREENPPAFWLGKYPVSNAQFGRFVQARGYENGEYWPEARAAGFWKNGKFNGRYVDEARNRPVQYGEPFGLPNHPVVGVSWYEAAAFARWLDGLAHQQGWIGAEWQVRLPDETQWEKAARGGQRIPDPANPGNVFPLRAIAHANPAPAALANPLPERAYPWGDDLSINFANVNETRIGATSAAGCFARYAGPYGNEDLAGNVWEWQRNWYDQDQDLKDTRGGAWYDDPIRTRCTAHLSGRSSNVLQFVGFRVSLSPPS